MRSSLVHPRAFTLIEMIISGVILALIMGTCASVLVLSARSRVTDSGSDPTSLAIATRSALDGFVSELKCANNITAKSASSITFTVPDRDSDGEQETVRYYLSNGDLCRSYNSFSGTVLSGCNTFSLSYTDKTGALPVPVESAEQLLMSYTVTPNALTALSTTAWECQYFNPAAIMPAKAVSWKITKVQLELKRASSTSTGTINVQVKSVDSTYKPIGSALATGSINVTTIPLTYTWMDIPFSTPAAELSPGAGMALVITSSSATSNATVGGVITISPALTNMSECATANSGVSWSAADSTAALDFKVYGTITAFP